MSLFPDSEIRVRFVYARYHEVTQSLPYIIDQDPISDTWFGNLRWRVRKRPRRPPLVNPVFYMAMEESVLVSVGKEELASQGPRGGRR